SCRVVRDRKAAGHHDPRVRAPGIVPGDARVAPAAEPDLVALHHRRRQPSSLSSHRTIHTAVRTDLPNRRTSASRRTATTWRAATRASIGGLAGVSWSQVAGELGLSKSSIQAAFPTKEQLQLGAVEAAGETFIREVVTPALNEPEGLPRLRRLVASWLAYVEH